MKKLAMVLITMNVLFACKKDEAPTAMQDAFAALQGKYLVCDSVKTTANAITTVQVLGKGKGWDRSFGLYGNLEVYTTPVTYKSYTFSNPDKIYYWPVGTTAQNSPYYTILSINGNKMVLTDQDQASGKVYTEYFTAE